MIGLSPLSAGHRRRFQPTCVRPSTGSYPRFSLPTDSSPGFASAARDCVALLRLAFASAPFRLTSPRASDSLAHSTKGTPSPPEGLRLLVGARFQVLFHSPPGVLFTFPSRYWSTIGHRGVFRLGWWSTQVRTGFHVPGPTQGPGTSAGCGVRVRGRNPLRRAFPCASAPPSCISPGPAGPGLQALQPRWRKGCRPRALTGLAMAPFRSPLLGGSRC